MPGGVELLKRAGDVLMYVAGVVGAGMTLDNAYETYLRPNGGPKTSA